MLPLRPSLHSLAHSAQVCGFSSPAAVAPTDVAALLAAPATNDPAVERADLAFDPKPAALPAALWNGDDPRTDEAAASARARFDPCNEDDDEEAAEDEL